MKISGKNIRLTARLIIVVYLFLSVAITTPVPCHTEEHHHSSGHAAQHLSFICTWMCAAATFIHSADPDLCQTFSPSPGNAVVSAGTSWSRPPVTSFHIRPPPFPLS